ncbi:hypothetical protein [Paenibacillus sp. YN15]|uniref:hypothetical protein n=1 Tax=Paenibacillus sp. YN15 TaxID=1742774 RepID=UPI000DCD6FB6|nr:hypothetical protein [Paenibacillus sp. YN15]RAU97873.1 hypothetical protein DQG13_17985 [Paenibacillus sp. YN15]
MFIKPLPAFCCVLLAAAMVTACGAGSGESRIRSYSGGAAPVEAAAGSAASIHSGARSYAADAKTLKESIARIPGVTGSSVLFNGLTAFITLHLDKTIDIEESMNIRKHAQETLEQLLPQYEVRVSVEKNHIF